MHDKDGRYKGFEVFCKAENGKWVTMDECQKIIECGKCPFSGSCLEKKRLEEVMKGNSWLPVVIVED